MSLETELQAIAAKIKPYEAFALLATKAIGGPTSEIASLIAAGLDALAGGTSGALTADEVNVQMAALLAGEAADDAAADAAVAARRGGA